MAPAGADADALCRLLDTGNAPAPGVDGEALRTFYRERDCTPLWFQGGALTPAGRSLVDRLRAVESVDTAFSSAQSAAEAAGRGELPPHEVARAELLLTAGFAALAVDPAEPSVAPSDARAFALAASTANDAQALRRAVPADPQIRRLRSALAMYMDMAAAGRWSRLPDGPALRMGDRGPRVVLLRERLEASSDLARAANDRDLFDAALQTGLSRFQSRHGLASDGILGTDTLQALNVSMPARIEALRANLQRLVRQNRDWGPRYIVVNIPAASITLVEDGGVVFQRRAIVGRPSWRTPELDSVIDRLEFHPSWVVPVNIAREEILPRIRKDPNYLKRNGMRLVSGQITQAPGPHNPLGKVKFLFDNPYSVYLHDTNAPELFERAERFLSHGCVRVEQALDLARRLLAGDADWPGERIDETVAVGKTIRVQLRRPVAVHLVYDTAWVDERGVVNFRPDAYGLDPTSTALRTTAGSKAEGACGS